MAAFAKSWGGNSAALPLAKEKPRSEGELACGASSKHPSPSPKERDFQGPYASVSYVCHEMAVIRGRISSRSAKPPVRPLGGRS